MTKVLAIVCTINNHKKHTLSFARHLTRNSDCLLILFLDNPKHISYFRRFKPDNLILIPCTSEYWTRTLGRFPENMPEKQHTNIEKGASIARDLGYEWSISIDSDELILNLDELVDNIDELSNSADLLRLKPAELIHDHKTAYSKYPFSGKYFRLFMDKKALREKLSGLENTLYTRLKDMGPLTRHLFFGHTNGKTVFRLAAPITQYKQHKQFSDTAELIEIILPRKFLILHFDAMNYSSWRHKWKRRLFGKTKATAISDKRRIQTALIAETFKGVDFSRGRKMLSNLWDGRKLFNSWYVFTDDELQQMIKAGLVMEHRTR